MSVDSWSCFPSLYSICFYILSCMHIQIPCMYGKPSIIINKTLFSQALLESRSLASSRFYCRKDLPLRIVSNDLICLAWKYAFLWEGGVQIFFFALLFWAPGVNGNWGGGSRTWKVIKKSEKKRHHLYCRGVGEYWGTFRVRHAFCCLRFAKQRSFDCVKVRCSGASGYCFEGNMCFSQVGSRKVLGEYVFF